MKNIPSDFVKNSGFSHSNRSRLRWTEWLIAILFVVSLLIGSGIFVKAGNAANLKTNSYSGLSYGNVNTIPGPMRSIQPDSTKNVLKALSNESMQSLDSCELKETS